MKTEQELELLALTELADYSTKVAKHLTEVKKLLKGKQSAACVNQEDDPKEPFAYILTEAEIAEEIWESIPGFERYQVSNMGRVKSLISKEPKMLTVLITKAGKVQVNLSNIYADKRNRPVRKSLARLVAEAFIPNPGNLRYVRRLTDRKLDNRVCSLQWSNTTKNTTRELKFEVI